MAPPAHVSSEIASDSKRNLSSNMETIRGNSSVLTNPRGKGLRCIKSEDSVLMDDPHTGLDTEEDVAVNINDSTDGTEYSSSFADSASGNEICSGLSDAEVQSQFFADDGLASAFDDFGAMFPMRSDCILFRALFLIFLIESLHSSKFRICNDTYQVTPILCHCNIRFLYCFPLFILILYQTVNLLFTVFILILY